MVTSNEGQVWPRGSRYRHLVALLGTLVLMVAACGSGSDADDSANTNEPNQPDVSQESPGTDDWDAIVESASDEGSLLIYSSNSPQYNDTTIAAFEAAYPDIDVTVQRIADPELIPRADAEYDTRADTADVLLVVDPTWTTDKTEADDYVVPMVGPNISELSDDLVIGDSEAVVTSGIAIGYAYNTNAYPDGVDLEDLVNDEFDGRIAASEPNSDSTVQRYDYFVGLYGEEWLEGIGNNRPASFPSMVPMVQSVASGEFDVAIGATPAVIPEGAPVAMGYADPPLGSAFHGLITGRGTSPNAAQVFMNWLVSPEGQETWAAGGIAVAEGVDTAEYTFAEVLQPESVGPEYVSQRRAEIEAVLFG